MRHLPSGRPLSDLRYARGTRRQVLCALWRANCNPCVEISQQVVVEDRMARTSIAAMAPASEVRTKPVGLYWNFLDDSKIAPITRGIVVVALFNIAVALYMALFYAPTERTMGDAQRIFYFHVPSAWVGFLAFFVVFVASVMYLWRRERKWDAVALSAAEIGVVFTTLVLLTGPLWAKAAWGVFWTWDAKLTATLVLWMIYLGYLMLRNNAEGERRARFA